MELLEQLAVVIESMSKPGVLGAVGAKIEKRCTNEIASYFRILSHPLIAAKLEELVPQPKEYARAVAASKVGSIVAGHSTLLKEVLRANSEKAWVASYGMKHIHEADQPLDFVGDSAQAAADWAESHAAETISGIDATTAETIADAIATGIEDQLGVDGTGRLIRETLDDFTVSRAQTIASTEMNRAMSNAALEKLKDLEVEYKQVINSPGACDICVEIADAGPIPVDEDFDSEDGDAYPPFHVNCRCAVTGARAPIGESRRTA